MSDKPRHELDYEPAKPKRRFEISDTAAVLAMLAFVALMALVVYLED